VEDTAVLEGPRALAKKVSVRRLSPLLPRTKQTKGKN